LLSPDKQTELEQFLLDNIESYEELEVILYLCDHDQALDAETLARELRIPVEGTQSALETLRQRGLVRCTTGSGGSFRYVPRSSAADDLVKTLLAEYQRDRVHVVGLMTKSAMARLRSAALKTFADCFRLGRSKKDG
jgi:hypothetical protein